jgi:GxxExxY protein
VACQPDCGWRSTAGDICKAGLTGGKDRVSRRNATRLPPPHGRRELRDQRMAVFEVPTLWAPDSSRGYTSGLCSENSAFVASAPNAEASFAIGYKGHSVGEYFADILVEDELVLELKCVECLANEHTAQCLNYLRASGHPAVGYFVMAGVPLNFSRTPWHFCSSSLLDPSPCDSSYNGVRTSTDSRSLQRIRAFAMGNRQCRSTPAARGSRGCQPDQWGNLPRVGFKQRLRRAKGVPFESRKQRSPRFRPDLLFRNLWLDLTVPFSNPRLCPP